VRFRFRRPRARIEAKGNRLSAIISIPINLGRQVWIAEGDPSYHIAACRLLPSPARPITEPEAIAQGLKACEGCLGE
jgi:hypothetical protein